MADVRDFHIIERLIEQQKRECVKLTTSNTFENKSNTFYFVVFKLLFGLNNTLIDACLTDQSYLTSMGRSGGKDGGIDAIYIQDAGKNKIVHLFTFKHTDILRKSMEAISSDVFDKLLFYVGILTTGSYDDIPDDYSQTIKDYTKQIFDLIAENQASFVLHICGNFAKIDHNEKLRFETRINELPLFSIEYNLLDDLIGRFICKDRKSVGGKIAVKKKKYFAEYVSPDTNACKTLIAKIDALTLLKLLSENPKLRNKVNWTISDFNNYELNENAFDDNVRVFLGASKTNEKMIATATSECEKENFYYYNNGITILCRSCLEGISSNTTFTIDDIQIVNGSQTIHNLAQLCKNDPESISNIYLLCRFYSVIDHNIHTHIAEYTNSQHQVKPRDIKALDAIQIKLEKEFDLIGIKYERKKNQYKGGKGSKLKRLDSEKCGKMLIAFYAEDPSTARNDPSSIFTSKYNTAFMGDVSADKILIVKKYHDYIEDCRKKKEKLLTDQTPKCYYNIKYSSFFYLFAVKKVCDNFNKNAGVVSYELSDDKLEKAYEIAYNLFTLVSHNKLKTAPNTDLSDYFKANSAKSDFCTEFKKISTLSNIEDAKTKSSELLQNDLQQPIIGE